MRRRAGRNPITEFPPSHRETIETWWIETKPTRWGWRGIAKSNHDRYLGASIDGFGGFPMWRPTERWAHRAVLRVIRLYRKQEGRRQQAEDLTHVYPVDD